jgi:hypothetical protein
MTTTLLLMTLMLGQTNPGNVGLDSETAARRLLGVEAPAAPGYAPQASRLALLEERRQLVEQMPTLGAPIVMLALSPLPGVLGGFMWAAFEALDGFKYGWGLIFAVPAFVFAVILTGGAVALAAVGTVLLARRAKEIELAEAQIGRIDEQLRTGWPTRAPAPPSR